MEGRASGVLATDDTYGSDSWRPDREETALSGTDMPIYNIAGVDAEALAAQMTKMPRQELLSGLMARLPCLD